MLSQIQMYTCLYLGHNHRQKICFLFPPHCALRPEPSRPDGERRKPYRPGFTHRRAWLSYRKESPSYQSSRVTDAVLNLTSLRRSRHFGCAHFQRARWWGATGCCMRLTGNGERSVPSSLRQKPFSHSLFSNALVSSQFKKLPFHWKFSGNLITKVTTFIQVSL